MHFYAYSPKVKKRQWLLRFKRQWYVRKNITNRRKTVIQTKLLIYTYILNIRVKNLNLTHMKCISLYQIFRLVAFCLRNLVEIIENQRSVHNVNYCSYVFQAPQPLNQYPFDYDNFTINGSCYQISIQHQRCCTESKIHKK